MCDSDRKDIEQKEAKEAKELRELVNTKWHTKVGYQAASSITEMNKTSPKDLRYSGSCQCQFFMFNFYHLSNYNCIDSTSTGN